MHMSFYFSSTFCDFLFPGINIVTTWAMVSLCLGLVTLSVLLEGFKVARTQLFNLSSVRQSVSSSDAPQRIKIHVLQSFLHVLHLTLGYILMLVVMTYNAYFSIAVIGGAGIGYYFFAPFDLPGKILGASSSLSVDIKGLHNSSARTEVLPLQSTEDHPTHVNSHLVCEKDYNEYNEKKALDGMTKAH